MTFLGVIKMDENEKRAIEIFNKLLASGKQKICGLLDKFSEYDNKVLFCLLDYDSKDTDEVKKLLKSLNHYLVISNFNNYFKDNKKVFFNTNVVSLMKQHVESFENDVKNGTLKIDSDTVTFLEKMSNLFDYGKKANHFFTECMNSFLNFKKEFSDIKEYFEQWNKFGQLCMSENNKIIKQEADKLWNEEAKQFLSVKQVSYDYMLSCVNKFQKLREHVNKYKLVPERVLNDSALAFDEYINNFREFAFNELYRTERLLRFVRNYENEVLCKVDKVYKESFSNLDDVKKNNDLFKDVSLEKWSHSNEKYIFDKEAEKCLRNVINTLSMRHYQKYGPIYAYSKHIDTIRSDIRLLNRCVDRCFSSIENMLLTQCESVNKAEGFRRSFIDLICMNNYELFLKTPRDFINEYKNKVLPKCPLEWKNAIGDIEVQLKPITSNCELGKYLDFEFGSDEFPLEKAKRFYEVILRVLLCDNSDNTIEYSKRNMVSEEFFNHADFIFAGTEEYLDFKIGCPDEIEVSTYIIELCDSLRETVEDAINNSDVDKYSTEDMVNRFLNSMNFAKLSCYKNEKNDTAVWITKLEKCKKSLKNKGLLETVKSLKSAFSKNTVKELNVNEAIDELVNKLDEFLKKITVTKDNKEGIVNTLVALIKNWNEILGRDGNADNLQAGTIYDTVINAVKDGLNNENIEIYCNKKRSKTAVWLLSIKNYVEKSIEGIDPISFIIGFKNCIKDVPLITFKKAAVNYDSVKEAIAVLNETLEYRVKQLAGRLVWKINDALNDEKTFQEKFKNIYKDKKCMINCGYGRYFSDNGTLGQKVKTLYSSKSNKEKVKALCEFENAFKKYLNKTMVKNGIKIPSSEIALEPLASCPSVVKIVIDIDTKPLRCKLSCKDVVINAENKSKNKNDFEAKKGAFINILVKWTNVIKTWDGEDNLDLSSCVNDVNTIWNPNGETKKWLDKVVSTCKNVNGKYNRIRVLEEIKKAAKSLPGFTFKRGVIKDVYVKDSIKKFINVIESKKIMFKNTFKHDFEKILGEYLDACVEYVHDGGFFANEGRKAKEEKKKTRELLENYTQKYFKSEDVTPQFVNGFITVADIRSMRIEFIGMAAYGYETAKMHIDTDFKNLKNSVKKETSVDIKLALPNELKAPLFVK